MKKSILFAAITAALLAAPLAIAKNSQPVLADITPGGCSFTQVSPFGTSLMASWGWYDGTTQTHFGGDAEFMVSASVDGGDTYQDFYIEFELVQYEMGMPADYYDGSMVYRCSNNQTMESGRCNASVLGVRDALKDAVIDFLGTDEETLDGNYSASLMGVTVKALKNKGRQNYELTDVCDVEL